MTHILSQAPQNERRDQWFAATRAQFDKLINPDGTGKMPQFNAPWREPVWILPAIYTGGPEFIDLANRMVEQYRTLAYERVAYERVVEKRD